MAIPLDRQNHGLPFPEMGYGGSIKLLCAAISYLGIGDLQEASTMLNLDPDETAVLAALERLATFGTKVHVDYPEGGPEDILDFSFRDIPFWLIAMYVAGDGDVATSNRITFALKGLCILGFVNEQLVHGPPEWLCFLPRSPGSWAVLCPDGRLFRVSLTLSGRVLITYSDRPNWRWQVFYDKVPHEMRYAISPAGALAVRTLRSEVGLRDVNDSTRGPKPPKKRATRQAAEPLIAAYLMRRPHATAAEVAGNSGCSAGLVAESTAWKVNRTRLKVAKQQGIDPQAVRLDERVVNAAGGNQMRQLHDHREQVDRLTNEIDDREKELFRQIGEFRKDHPDATSQEVAAAVGCTAGDVERRQVILDRLATEQSTEQAEEMAAEPLNSKRGLRQKRVRRRV